MCSTYRNKVKGTLPVAMAGVHGQKMGDEQCVAGDHCVAYIDILHGAACH